MAGELDDVTLQNAQIDAANLSLIVNGPATGGASIVALRTGGTSNTVARQLATAAKGDPGPKGDTGAAGVASLPQLAVVRNPLLVGRNLLDPTAFTAGTFLNLDGSLGTNAAYGTSGLIVSNSGGSMNVNIAPFASGGIGYNGNVCHYDQTGTFTEQTVVDGSGNYSCPATSATHRMCWQTNGGLVLSTLSVVNGPTQPSTLQSFTYYPTNIVDGKLSPLPSLANLAAAHAPLLTSRNLCDPTTFVAGYLDGTNGTVASSGAYTTSAMMISNTGGTVSISPAPFTFSTNGGVCHYDKNGSFVLQNQVSEGTVSCPANSATFRITYSGDQDLTAISVVWGATQPATFQSFAQYSASIIDSKLAAISSTVAAEINLAAVSDPGVIGSLFPLGQNLFSVNGTGNYLVNTATGVVDSSHGTAYPTSNRVRVAGMTKIISSVEPFYSAGQWGITCYDINGNYLGPIAGPYAANTLISLLPNTYECLIPYGPYPVLAQNMVMAGTTAAPPVLPSTFVPYLAGAGPNTPFTDLNVCFVGDSISASNLIEPGFVAATGCVNAFQDARGGRNLQQIFECYGGDPVAGLNQTAVTGSPDPVTQQPPTYHNSGTTGNTLTQDLAAASADFIIIELGTNDYSNSAQPNLGYPTDASTANTVYGHIYRAIEGYQKAMPRGCRMGFITPRWNGFTGFEANYAAGTNPNGIIIDAIVLACKLRGIPCLKWNEVSEMCAYVYSLPYGKATDGLDATQKTLTVDGTHPTVWSGMYIDGPLWAKFFAPYAPKIGARN